MEFGRVIRVRYPDGKTTLYVVTEQDAARAEAILAAKVGAAEELEHVGHASLS
jgi:hypothetical protein